MNNAERIFAVNSLRVLINFPIASSEKNSADKNFARDLLLEAANRSATCGARASDERSARVEGQ